jgi:hypothetical protein
MTTKKYSMIFFDPFFHKFSLVVLETYRFLAQSLNHLRLAPVLKLLNF